MGWVSASMLLRGGFLVANIVPAGREGAHGIEEYMNVKFVAFGGL